MVQMMVKKKSKKESGDATRASVLREMARPRMARSARLAEMDLDHAQNPERTSGTVAGTVDKIIPSPRPRHRSRQAP